MPREVRNGEEDEKSEGLWKGLVRDLLVAGIIVVIVLVGIYVYTGVWPPLVVVESQSMQHSGTESYFGVIDTGDMVFQQAAPNRADVVTYLEGRASGYATYGDYGDVIIFRHASDPTPVITGRSCTSPSTTTAPTQPRTWTGSPNSPDGRPPPIRGRSRARPPARDCT